ncbi:MAG: ABC transporter ATP-binding protein/permease [Desulfobulbaceae bacterium]|jgi:ATP-binding cassette subfamily B protein|nr:ABC transporter ATP-binding protein/permease [Desulfobulbaceae bacterium]
MVASADDCQEPRFVVDCQIVAPHVSRPIGHFFASILTLVFFVPASEPSGAVPISALLSLLRPFFRRHRSRLILGFAALVAVDILQLITPRIIKYGIDALTTGTSQDYLTSLAWLLLALAIFSAALRFCWRYMIVGFSRILEHGIRCRIFEHLLKMDAPFFERRTTGDLMAHCTNDLAAIQLACGIGLVSATDAVVLSGVAICFMLYIHPQLTLVALTPMPFLIIGTKYLSGKLHRRFTSVQEIFSEMTEFSRAAIVSIRLLKAHTMETTHSLRFEALGRKYVRGNLKVATIHGLMFPLATMVGSLGMLLILWYGGRLALENVITLGDFVAFITYLYLLIWPMMAIGWVASLVQRGLTSLGRIHSLLTVRPFLPELADDGLTPPGREIVLRHLDFSYPEAKAAALNDISLTFYPGLYGIIGRTGSGKSTLLKLLVRLYPVADGALLFDGRDANSLPTAAIQRAIAYVGQEAVLFSNSIAANIALGKETASREEIIAVAKAAAVHDDILSLAEGYETRIGERGARLSGGQKQRVALARALLCDRPILIIDDGLSAVDVDTEERILLALADHFRDRIVLLVSNRLKTLAAAREIIVLDQGRIVARGDHRTMMRQSHLYQAMVAKQLPDKRAEHAI